MTSISRGPLPLRALRPSTAAQLTRPQWHLPIRLGRVSRRALATEQSGTTSQANETEGLKNVDAGFNFRGVRHARPLPVSPSYFSRTPHFNDNLVRLSNLLNQHRDLPTVPKDQLPPMAWKTAEHYRSTSGEPVKMQQYGRALQIVKRLYAIQPGLVPDEVTEVLGEFRRDINPFLNQPRDLFVDRFGRGHGVGKRKEAVARAWVVEGTGEVLVNGKSLSEAFGRVHDRESAVWPLRATERLDKYNVWALVAGGGTTGQAEALTLAIAKGLLAHEPALKPALRKAGCITRDPRTVERKKAGHLKARKSPAWVKR